MKKNLHILAILGVFSLAFLFLPSYAAESEALQDLTLKTRDIFFKIRRLSTVPPELTKKIVIVSIDEESSERLGARWPWPRSFFAKMLDELRIRGAKGVGLNMSFTGLESGDDSGTRELSRAIKAQRNVVVGVTFDNQNRLVKPNPLIAQAVSRYGYLEKIVDPDFVIRRSYLLRPYESQEEAEYSFPLQLAASYLETTQENSPRFDRDLQLLTLGMPPIKIYLEDDGSYTINYLAVETDFKIIPAWMVLNGKVSKKDIEGRYVLVGLTSSLFSDIHPTPYGLMPGIAIHANELLAILSGRMLHLVPNWFTFLLSGLVALCVLALFLFRRFWLGFLGAFVALFGLFIGAQIAFAKDVIMEPFILFLGPLLATLVGVATNLLILLLENRGLESKVIQDKMTGLFKYEYLRERLEEEWKRCQQAKLPISIVMTDLDRFKKINDTLGHEVGNMMIRRTADVIKESARRYDIVSRYGGDEFVILLWHANFTEAKAYKERLRNMYAEMVKRLEPSLQDSSISIGVATFDPNTNADFPPNPQVLVEEADKDLFLDKESRRKK